MSDQNKFSYQAKSPTIIFMRDNMDKAEIQDVTFLTTARVKYVVDDVVKEDLFDIDLINQQAYFKDGRKTSFANNIFQHLNEINELPDEFFSPSNDSLQNTQGVLSDHEKMLEENLQAVKEPEVQEKEGEDA